MGELCLAVENECPVGKHFGVSGIGEGLVFKPIDPAWNSSKFWFKVKGSKHSVSKVKTLAAIDVEKVQNIPDFIEKTVTENRLKQGVEVLQRNGVGAIEHKHIGDFIRWVYNDVIKEEKDTLLASGLEEKDLGGPVAKKAKEWLFKNYLS
jgi:CxxC motif-containing protein